MSAGTNMGNALGECHSIVGDVLEDLEGARQVKGFAFLEFADASQQSGGRREPGTGSRLGLEVGLDADVAGVLSDARAYRPLSCAELEHRTGLELIEALLHHVPPERGVGGKRRQGEGVGHPLMVRARQSVRQARADRSRCEGTSRELGSSSTPRRKGGWIVGEPSDCLG
jgi:hypothetical protein